MSTDVVASREAASDLAGQARAGSRGAARTGPGVGPSAGAREGVRIAALDEARPMDLSGLSDGLGRRSSRALKEECRPWCPVPDLRRRCP